MVKASDEGRAREQHSIWPNGINHRDNKLTISGKHREVLGNVKSRVSTYYGCCSIPTSKETNGP